MADPRDNEETPDMWAGVQASLDEWQKPADPEPAKPPSAGPTTDFFPVENQKEVRACYICGRPCAEICQFKNSFHVHIHYGCWYTWGGGRGQWQSSTR